MICQLTGTTKEIVQIKRTQARYGLGPELCARAARYHTNAIAVSDFTIAQGSGHNYVNVESDDLSRAQKMSYFFLSEGKLAEACMHFTTRDLTSVARFQCHGFPTKVKI